MNSATKKAAWLCWILTIACCVATLILGFNVIAAKAIGGLFDLVTLQPGRTSKVGNDYLLLALAPSALAVTGNAWMLWWRPSREPGVSPWWLAASFAIALLTFLFGAYVCIDVW